MRVSQIGFLACALVLELAAAAEAQAAVGETTLKGLTRMSEQIVLGRVSGVFEIEGVPVASVTVRDVLKGPQVDEILVLARGTWLCDTGMPHSPLKPDSGRESRFYATFSVRASLAAAQ